jgi:hypothetical protein
MNKKLFPMLLAGSVLVTGFTGAFIYAPTAYGITSVDELSDVDRSSWAFDALRDLVEKYNVIEGYPDKTFRGDHKATRYEMAAALNALIRHIGKDIARLGTEKADKEDLAKLAKLQEEFKAELAALQARTDALEARAAKIEAKNEEQDNRLTVLEKLKIYGDVTFGGYADMGGRGGTGTPFVGQGHNFYALNAGTGQYTARNSPTAEGLNDAISAIGRVRVNIDYPIVEDEDGEGAIGDGMLHTRIVGAYGRVSPMLSGGDAARRTDGAGMLSGVSRIAADSSAFNEGVRTGNLSRAIVSGSNTRANLYVESAYYTQEFRSGIPLLTDLLPGVDLLPDDENWKMSMKMKMGLIPWREIFQQSPYTGDETQQFQNTAMLNNAAIPVNAIGPTVAFEWHQGLGEWHSLDVKTALSALDVSDAMSAFAVTYEGSLNYNFGWLADWLDHPGNVYAGGWWLNGRGGSNSLVGVATGNGINGRTVASVGDLARGLSNDPIDALRRTNLAVTGPQVAAAEVAMGLPVGSLSSPGTLANGLGIPVGSLNNLNAVLPNAITITNGIVAKTLLPGTTLGEYYREMLNTFGVGVAAGVLPGGDDRNGAVDVNDNANGFYVGLNQELYRGAGVFFSYGVSDTGPQSMLSSALMNGTGRNTGFNGGFGTIGANAINNIYGVKQAFNMGGEIPMKALHLPWRQKDVLGIGYAMLDPNDAYGSAYAGTRTIPGGVTAGTGQLFAPPNGGAATAPINVLTKNYNQTSPGFYTKSYAEHIIEMYYKVHINDRFSITPNVQFIINRLGDAANDLMTVIGVRSTFNF